jgi:hypothetical protein
VDGTWKMSGDIGQSTKPEEASQWIHSREPLM